MKIAGLGVALALAGTAVSAQSSLGIQGADLTFGALQDEAGQSQTQAELVMDVAITGNHGLQGELAFTDTAYGTIGTLGAHLYLAPRPDRKYGVFLTLSDVDGRSMAWGTVGIEGMRAISDTTTISGRTGLGVSDVEGLDFIFAGAGIAHEFSPSTTLPQISKYHSSLSVLSLIFLSHDGTDPLFLEVTNTFLHS